MKTEKIEFVFALAVALTMGVCAKDATDGLVGWWRVEQKPNGTALVASDFRDHVHAGSSALSVNHATEDGDFPAYPICHTNMDLVYPMGSGKIPNAPCLYLSQPTNYAADGSCYINHQRIVFPAGKIDIAGKPCTFIARIKPFAHVVPGNLTIFTYDYSWGENKGWRVYLNPQSSGTSVNWAYPAIYIGKNSQNANAITAGFGYDAWHDLGVAIEPNVPEAGKTQVTFYFCNGNGLTERTGKGNITHVQTVVVDDVSGNTADVGSREISIGDTIGSDTYTKKEDSTASFRGLIHEMKLYDRVLTKEEFEQACAPYTDPLFSVGSKNGSTDEFSDETAEELYIPFEMPWRKLRKTLAAENPSLSIKTSLKADDKDVSRILEFTPFYSEDCPSDANIEVLLNGTKVAEVPRNAETDRLVHLNGKTIGRLVTLTDGAYPLTLTLKRTGGMGGSISFDRISLGGGWQLGKRDSKATEFRPWASIEGAPAATLYSRYTYYLARQDTYLIPGPFYSTDAKQQTLRLKFSVSDALAKCGEFDFATRHIGGHTIETYLNGTLIDSRSSHNVEYALTIGKEQIKAGINELMMKVISGAGGFSFDYFRLTPKRFPRGLTYIVR